MLLFVYDVAKGRISLFCMWVSSCFRSICWKDYSFHIALHQQSGQESLWPKNLNLLHWSLIFFNFIYLFLLYNIVLVLPYINMNLPRGPNPEPPSTSLPIPSLWVIPVHQPQASCILHWTCTGDSFLIWYYTCFNAILPIDLYFYPYASTTWSW